MSPASDFFTFSYTASTLVGACWNPNFRVKPFRPPVPGAPALNFLHSFLPLELFPPSPTGIEGGGLHFNRSAGANIRPYEAKRWARGRELVHSAASVHASHGRHRTSCARTTTAPRLAAMALGCSGWGPGAPHCSTFPSFCRRNAGSLRVGACSSNLQFDTSASVLPLASDIRVRMTLLPGFATRRRIVAGRAGKLTSAGLFQTRLGCAGRRRGLSAGSCFPDRWRHHAGLLSAPFRRVNRRRPPRPLRPTSRRTLVVVMNQADHRPVGRTSGCHRTIDGNRALPPALV